MTWAASALVAFLVALVTTEITRRYALAHSMLDIPSERSAHRAPTPRGGGLGIALGLASAVALAQALQPWPLRLLLGFGLGAVLVAAVGFLDDHRPVSPLWRALVHLAACGVLVLSVGGSERLDLGLVTLPLGTFGAVLATLASAWLVNLWNFMDGSDGLAASQAAAVALVAAVLTSAAAPAAAVLLVALAGACLGFLIWNWPPARIFMGDVGSYVIGYTLAAAALMTIEAGAVPALAWLVLPGCFIADASLTLAARVAAGERWYTAHRGHAYQRLMQLGWSHGRLAVHALVLTLAVLAPLAVLITAVPGAGLPVAIVCAWGAVRLWRGIQRRHALALDGSRG